MIQEVGHIFLILLLMYILAYAYLRIAANFSIVDKPNLRSSHTNPVVRGGGIIFPISWLLFFIFNDLNLLFVSIGLFFISFISFMDDLRDINPLVRISFHLFSFALCFYQLGLFSEWPFSLILLSFILCIGTVNAFNFMDGINGMTGLYGLVFILTFIFSTGLLHSQELLSTLIKSPYVYLISALLVFCFLNVRRKAKCFAGDVGSISLAYIIIYFLLSHIREGILLDKSGFFSSLKYILFLGVYGVDSVLTIIQRIYLGQNIFTAHRIHLYQLLANEMKLGHLPVSFGYALIQLVINLIVISIDINYLTFMTILMVLVSMYVIVKKIVQNKILINL